MTQRIQVGDRRHACLDLGVDAREQESLPSLLFFRWLYVFSINKHKLTGTLYRP